jgi:hypothetical protein
MKDILRARAANYRERAAADSRDAEEATSDDLRRTYVGLACGAWG